MDDIPESTVKELFYVEKKSHAEISRALKAMYPGQRGLSERSVRRFCLNHGICRSYRITDDELDERVKTAVSQTGPTWGRKMIKGWLKSNGIIAGDKRIGKSLWRVSPLYQKGRSLNAQRNINPIPYKADYFGHKMHVDQNEKLSMYGMTHVCASDGYSGKILSFATMPVKNNLLIYENVYRAAVLKYGMWDQVRVDHGTEFYLSLFIQEKMKNFRSNTRRAPFIQSMSKENHPAERKWVEFNSRVNFPIKRVLNDMVNEDLLDMDDVTIKFSVSFIASQVAEVGVKQVFDSWNHHSIPGKGIPDILMRDNNKAFKLPSSDVLPTMEEAVISYENEGGHLTRPEVFGVDLLRNYPDLQNSRLAQFKAHFPSMEPVFHGLVNGHSRPFKEGLLHFIDLTASLYP